MPLYPAEVKNLASAAKAAASLALFPERMVKKYVTVECNEYFLDEMQEAVEWGDKVILYCGTGGVIGGGCSPRAFRVILGTSSLGGDAIASFVCGAHCLYAR